MKTENKETESYVAPQVESHALLYEGVLCQSRTGTNEGVKFEDWN